MRLELDYGYDNEGDPDDPIPYGYFPWQFGIDDSSEPFSSCGDLVVL
jgi:hypothetical protein